MDNEDDIKKTTKLRPLKCPRETILNHVQSGTEFHIWILISDLIDVVSLLATWPSVIFLQFDGALIILIGKIVTDIVSPLFQKVSITYHLCQYIVQYNNISPSWTLSVGYFFSGLRIVPAGSHGHESTIVSPHILVSRKCYINVSLYIDRFYIDNINGRSMATCTNFITPVSFF